MGEHKTSEKGLWFSLVLSFLFRAKSFGSCTSRQGRGIKLHSLATSLFWHNSALVYHGAFWIWSYCTGSERVRMYAPSWFWLLVASTLEVGELHFAAINLLKYVFIGALFYAYLIKLVVGVIVRLGPSIMTHTALYAQNWVHWSLTRTIRQDIHYGFWTPTGIEYEVHFTPSLALLWILSVGELGFEAVVNLLASMVIKNWEDSFRAQAVGEVGDLDRTEGEVGNQVRTEQVRLLTLLPGSSGKPICLLQWHNLKNPPTYTVISYFWEPDTLDHEIYVSGELVKVTKSASEVLVNIRSTWRTKTIWIDAICIKKNGDEDKALQLPFMLRICENASEVFVWLGRSKTAGPATSLVDRVFLVNRLRETAQTSSSYEISTDAARALKRMLKYRWFGRAWVVREIVRPRYPLVGGDYNHSNTAL
jgi:Heterokaryon incompatibility protein (HET)